MIARRTDAMRRLSHYDRVRAIQGSGNVIGFGRFPLFFDRVRANEIAAGVFAYGATA